MSSDDEAEQFVGDEQGLHGDSHEVADLTGADETPLDEEDSDNENDAGMPEDSHEAHDDSVHTFEGHTGTKLELFAACLRQLKSSLPIICALWGCRCRFCCSLECDLQYCGNRWRR